MKTLKFKCKLLSDVILNQKAATEGPNKTLDFIPGNCFLGIVASQLYDKVNADTSWILFHSGKVRFGDAHLSSDDVRGLKIPASMYYPKLQKPSEKCYIHHCIPNLSDESLLKEQIKQCRSGFFVFDSDSKRATKIKAKTNFAIKSAYDRDQRRSMDEQMYGYESLQKGLELLFEVQVDDDVWNLKDHISKSLCGQKRIGRSKTAQYGLVRIESFDFKDVKCDKVNENGIITVYADGRLIFLDEFGVPTFRPTTQQLGLPAESKILWENSQIRTFQYAPWNFKRQCFDTDRCGIEKGSVFVVENAHADVDTQYIGSYVNEGFGKVIYNPEFLKGDSRGIALYNISDGGINVHDDKKDSALSNDVIEDTTLLVYLKKMKKQEDICKNVYAMVNKWVGDNNKLFKGKAFASQWGNIRKIAMTYDKLDNLKNELFDKKIDKNGKTIPWAYLTHGVAKDKWKERGRLDLFKEFVNKLDNSNAQMAIINLAAEMAKKCKEDK